MADQNIWYVPDVESIEALKPDEEKKELVLDKRQARLERLYNLYLITGDYLLEQVGIPTAGFSYKTQENEEND